MHDAAAVLPCNGCNSHQDERVPLPSREKHGLYPVLAQRVRGRVRLAKEARFQIDALCGQGGKDLKKIGRDAVSHTS